MTPDPSLKWYVEVSQAKMNKKCASNRENSLSKGISVRKGMACLENHKQFGTAKK